MKLKNLTRVLVLALSLLGFVAAERAFADSQCVSNAASIYRDDVRSCGTSPSSSCIADARARYEQAVSACGGSGGGGGGGGGSQTCVTGRRCSHYDVYSSVCHLWETYTVCGYNVSDPQSH